MISSFSFQPSLFIVLSKMNNPNFGKVLLLQFIDQHITYYKKLILKSTLLIAFKFVGLSKYNYNYNLVEKPHFHFWFWFIAIDADVTNLEYYMKRSEILEELGDKTKAIQGFRRLLSSKNKIIKKVNSTFVHRIDDITDINVLLSISLWPLPS